MSKCKHPECGMEIVWKKTSAGKPIPLDPRVTVYSVVGEVAVKPTPGVTGEVFMVSHFNTCKKPNAFSGSRKPEPSAPERNFSEPEHDSEG